MQLSSDVNLKDHITRVPSVFHFAIFLKGRKGGMELDNVISNTYMAEIYIVELEVSEVVTPVVR